MVKLWVANTDLDWFDYLASQPHIDEVNFWQPSGSSNFGAITEGELFLFKLKSPRNVIGGFGVLSRSSNIPLSLAWEAFGTKNGGRDPDGVAENGRVNVGPDVDVDAAHQLAALRARGLSVCRWSHRPDAGKSCGRSHLKADGRPSVQ